MTQLYATSFESDTLDAVPAGWTDAWFGLMPVKATNPVTGTKALVSTDNNSRTVYSALPARGEQRIQYTTKAGSKMRVLTRFSGSAQSWTGYEWVVTTYRDSDFCGIQPRKVNGNFFSATDITGISLHAALFNNPSAVFVLEAYSVGTTHELRIWGQGGTRPTAPTFSFTDADYATGWPGVGGDANGTSIDDVVYYDSAPPAPAVPAAPTNIVATGGIGSASIAFTPGSDNGAAITSFTVTASSGETASGTTSPIGITGLGAGAKTFTVKATNSVGTSSASIPSNSVTITVDTVKPTLSSAVATNGDTIILTFSETLGAFTPAISDFTLSGAPATIIVRNGATITLSGFSTSYAFGDTITVSYAKPLTNGLRDVAGNLVDTFAPVAVTNNIPNRPVLAGYVVKLYGDDPAHDFSTPAALVAYTRSLSLTADSSPVMIYCYKDLNLSGQINVGPQQSTDINYITVRPAPGLGYSDIEADNAPSAYGTVGLEMNISDSWSRVGIVYEGWRVVHNSGMVRLRRDGWGQGSGTNVLGFQSCRIQVNSTAQPFAFGEYGSSPYFKDTLVIMAANSYSAELVTCSGGGRAERSTFVRQGQPGNTAPLFIKAGGGFDLIKDCLFSEMGGNPNNNAGGSNNYSNKPLDAGATNITAVSGSFFVSLSDFRPAAGTAMVGGASSSSISTNDNHGNNRGLTPDAGATQLVPAQPLPTGSITNQFPLDGQTLKITLTTANTPTSGKVTLTPANPANGASSIGPVDLVLGANAASIEIDDIPAGNYLAPTVTLTNAGGTVSVPGTHTFEVMGFGNLVYDGGGVGTGGGTAPTTPAPTITIATADMAVMSGKRATISGAVNLNGDANGQVNIFLDPQPSGVAVALGAANVTAGTWTKQADLAAGLYKLRVVATSAGQSTTASTGNIRVLGLAGNFSLPTA